jgi:hypothetical protein
MNLQTVDDLIDDLMRLSPAERRRPVNLALDTHERDPTIRVYREGNMTRLCQREDEVEGLREADVEQGRNPVCGVTCPDCAHEFEVNDDGEVI